MYCFDLTTDQKDSGHFNLQKDSSVRIDVKFAAAIARTLNCIILFEYENVLEIERNKNVIVDYSTEFTRTRTRTITATSLTWTLVK